MTSINKDEREDMTGSIRYIKFSGYCDKFDEWKEKTRDISRHKGILKYLTEELEIPTEYEVENDEEKMKIYEVNFKVWDFLIISLTYIYFGVVKQCDENAHYAWKSLIEKYEVSDDIQEILIEVTNRCNKCNIKDTSLEPDIWFNELYSLNLKFNNIKVKYEKDKDGLKAHVSDVLPEEYKPVRVSCNVNISKVEFKDLKKEMHWFWKIELNVR